MKKNSEQPQPMTLTEWTTSQVPRIWPLDLAKLAGIHSATSYRLLSGETWPTAKTAAAIARASNGVCVLWDIRQYTNGDDDEKG